MASRNWCFTINADEEQEKFWATATACPLAFWFDNPDLDYICCQVEKVHHVHMQGYVSFSKVQRLTALKKICPQAHWEYRRGTHAQAVKYCTKQESRINGPWELGHAHDKQGKRTDLENITALVKSKKTNMEILEEAGACASKFAKNIAWVRFTCSESDSDRQLQGVNVYVLYGATGCGKTFAAVKLMANGENYYIAECPSSKGTKLWFDGYEGQHTLILDDFSGDFCTFRFLLRLLDKYKLKVEIKGGFAWATWTTVIITTNIHPSAWYSDVDTAPLRRRINEIRFMEHQGAYRRMDWAEKPLDEDFVAFEALVQVAAAAAPHTESSTQPMSNDEEDLLNLD